MDRIDCDTMLRALGWPKLGKVYELGTEFGSDMPQGPRDTFAGFRVSPYRIPRALYVAPAPLFDFSMEVITASPHVGTHIDAMAHVQERGRSFGGRDIREVYSDTGWTANGIETSRPIIGRGILLDVAATKKRDVLPDQYAITPEDIQQCLTAQDTELLRGDIVLLRTGWFKQHYSTNPDAYFASQPGVAPEAACWLYDHGMAVLGTDTSATDVLPISQVKQSTHAALLVQRGVHIIEILNLETIAADHVYEFLFVCLPLRIKGGTGSWLRPIAII